MGMFDDLIPNKPATAGGGMFTDLIPQVPYEPPAVEPRVKRGGFQAQIGRTFAGQTPLTLTPEQKASNQRGFDAVARGVPIGVAQAVPGIPGNVEGLGRLALSPFGVSQERYLPTSGEVGNTLFGEPRTREEAAMRSLGELVGGPAVIAGTRKLGGATARLVARGSQPSQAAQEARAAGYALPPRMAQDRPSLVSRGLEAWGGKIKTQQAASAKNQDVTTLIAKRELGIPANQSLTDDVFEGVRKTAGQAYTALKNVKSEVVPDDAFRTAVTAAKEVDADVAAAFPELVSNKDVDTLVDTLLAKDKFTPSQGVGLVRHLRYQATANLKNAQDPAKQSLGLAQRKAAEAIDDLIERNLARSFSSPTTGKEIAAAMANDSYADWGLRVIPKGEQVQVGQTLRPSFKWVDGRRTRTVLPGTSTIRVTPKTIGRAVADLEKAGYQGDEIALVKGVHRGSGEDVGESIMEGAQIVAKWPRVGNQSLVHNYRQARRMIAMSHDVEAATNTATGDVSARTLAALQRRGRPLSGGLEAAAKAGSAFPKATQNTATFGDVEPFGILDLAGAAASAGAGRPDLAALLLGRPLARGLVLSKPYQNAVLGSGNASVPGASAISPRLLGLLSAQQLPALRNEPR